MEGRRWRKEGRKEEKKDGGKEEIEGRNCIYSYMYVCTYVCMYACIYVHLCMYVWIYVHMNLCICMYVCMNICIYVCIHVYQCMHVHKHVRAYERTYIKTRSGPTEIRRLSWNPVQPILIQSLQKTLAANIEKQNTRKTTKRNPETCFCYFSSN